MNLLNTCVYQFYFLSENSPAEQYAHVELHFLRIEYVEEENVSSAVEFLNLLIMKKTFINQLQKKKHLRSPSQDINSEVDDVELVEEGH